MDLTDERWVALSRSCPKPPKRADGRSRAWRDARAVLAAPVPYCEAKRIEDIGPLGNKRRANLGLPGWPRIEGL
jgi:hypothetical protein